MHAVPIARHFRAQIQRHANAVAGAEARSGRDQPDIVGLEAELLAHHRRVA